MLAGREPPPLALARLRVQGELGEFREADLQFDAAEVEALLQATPAAAGRVSAAQLLARTQGWAVGLRLALDTLSDGRPSAAALRSAALDRHVFDYLASEVLDRMPPELRGFLLRCAVLPELSAQRCAQVSGDAQAARWLEEIEQRGLFVSTLEGPELTLRLHDRFATSSKTGCSASGRRSCRRCCDAPPRARRTRCAASATCCAGASDEAAESLCSEGPDLITRGAVAPVLRMVGQFAPAQRDGPRLQLLRGMASWALWDFDAMCDAMHRAAIGFARDGDRGAQQLALAYGPSR